ncbi:MAG: vesicular-fusion protein S17 [Claussenomyces sp. TS43310]|nr:MAG: vesicular-fusion protein S17 [Claussenomyces sp. TS43310]
MEFRIDPQKDGSPDSFIQKADQAITAASTGWSFFSSKTDKWERAAKLCEDAAKSLERQQDERAGQMYEKCASIHANHLNEHLDAANSLIDAYKIYKKNQPEESARCLTTAISLFENYGSRRRVATCQQQLGQLYEHDLRNKELACEAYKHAAERFDSDNTPSSARPAWMKVVELSILTKADFKGAQKILENLAKYCMTSNILQYSCSELFFESALCLLTMGDMVAVNNALAEYVEMYQPFRSSPHYQFLSDLIQIIDSGEITAFEDRAYQWASLHQTPNWQIATLSAVKAKMVEKDEDFS